MIVKNAKTSVLINELNVFFRNVFTNLIKYEKMYALLIY